MRIGSNPEKTNNSIILDNYHRIVIPVYIPNFEGYFKDAFEIFKLCLDSLLDISILERICQKMIASVESS
jgi:hypothetical protein